MLYALRARGIDVQTALEAEMIERSDARIISSLPRPRGAYCAVSMFQCFNVGDFYRLYTSYMAQHKSHTGIVLARQQQYAVGEHMRRLLKLIAHLTAEEMKNRVEFLSAWGEV